MDDHRQEHVHSSDGTSIGVFIAGPGPPLVLVHGAWSWAAHWSGVAETAGRRPAAVRRQRRMVSAPGMLHVP